jgi:hypothetical protein
MNRSHGKRKMKTFGHRGNESQWITGDYFMVVKRMGYELTTRILLEQEM